MKLNNTRKLLQAIPEKDLGYKPSENSWTMGELVQHIATIYYWYVGAITQDVYDIAGGQLERGNTNDIKASLDFFETVIEMIIFPPMSEATSPEQALPFSQPGETSFWFLLSVVLSNFSGLVPPDRRIPGNFQKF